MNPLSERLYNVCAYSAKFQGAGWILGAVVLIPRVFNYCAIDSKDHKLLNIRKACSTYV